MKLYGKSDGKKIIFESKTAKDSVSRFLKKNKDKKVSLEYKKVGTKRTFNQNSLYWLTLRWFSGETGNDIEDLHELFKSKFLKKTIQFKEYMVEIPSSTTGLNTLKFSEFYKKVNAMILSLGYVTPKPEQLEEHFSK